jgi:hypothetical protein
MKRSTGVTVIAVLSLIGSILTLLMGIVLALLMLFASAPSSNDLPGSPMFFKVIIVGVVLIYLLLALWGILTSVGLLWLKNWARVSIIVFSVLLILMNGFGALLSLSVPFSLPNKPADASAMAGARIFMGGFSLALLGIGIWWLVFFTRARVKEQFVPALAGGPMQQAADATQVPYRQSITPGERPLSITILAWFLLAGCLFIPLNLWLHFPALLFTELVRGWPATTYYLAVAVLHLYLGIGLLRLQPTARKVGIAYFIFCFANSAVFNFAPGSRARVLALLEATRSVFPVWMHSAFQIDPTPQLIGGAVFGLAALTVPLYLLITRRQAFARALPGSMGGINQTQILQ